MAISKELVKYLYLNEMLVAGKKVINRDGKELHFDLMLRDAIFSNIEIRCEVADLYRKVLNERYSKSGRLECGLIGISWSLAPIVSILSNSDGCSCLFIANHFIDGSQKLEIFGKPVLGSKYAILDDSLITGKTIYNALRLWIYKGYTAPECIIVFCDREEGGMDYLNEEMQKLKEEFGVGNNIEIITFTTKREMLDLLKLEGMLSLSDYDRCFNGKSIAASILEELV